MTLFTNANHSGITYSADGRKNNKKSQVPHTFIRLYDRARELAISQPPDYSIVLAVAKPGSSLLGQRVLAQVRQKSETFYVINDEMVDRTIAPSRR